MIDGWNVTTTDTAIAFRKISRGSTRLSYPGWLVFLRELAETKKLPLPQVWARLEQVFLLFILGVFWLKILGLRQPVNCTFFCVANLVSQTWSVFPLICTLYPHQSGRPNLNSRLLNSLEDRGNSSGGSRTLSSSHDLRKNVFLND